MRLKVLAAGGEAPGPAIPASGRGAGPRRRFWIETWGCQMNEHDSERLAGQLDEMGFAAACSAEDADLILLNTCSVREKAAEKMFSRLGRLRQLKRARPGLRVGVLGCVAQQEKDRILSRSDVADFVLGPRATVALPELIEAAEAGQRRVEVSQRDDRYDAVRPIARAARHRAWITAVEGCSKSCSFCIVPLTRGPELSRPLSAILAEAEQAVESGAVELELLGQNVNAWRDGEHDFAVLLEQTGRIAGLRRLRFTTSHPRELTDRVIAAMAATPTVANHLHLPVQSGSNAVLKRMHRGYDRDRYRNRVAKLRRAIPDLAVSTDVIVGFPGETEAEFRDTLGLLAEIEFDQVFAFVYSARPGTRAAALDDPTPRPEKQARLGELFALQETISRRKNLAFVGRVVEVLVDQETDRGGQVQGRTRDNRIVSFPGTSGDVGRLVPVRIDVALAHSLLGARVAEV